jgi:hypothetical protein
MWQWCSSFELECWVLSFLSLRSISDPTHHHTSIPSTHKRFFKTLPFFTEAASVGHREKYGGLYMTHLQHMSIKQLINFEDFKYKNIL